MGETPAGRRDVRHWLVVVGNYMIAQNTPPFRRHPTGGDLCTLSLALRVTLRQTVDKSIVRQQTMQVMFVYFVVALVAYRISICFSTDGPTLAFKKRLGDDVTRIKAGQTLKLECEAGGHPVPTIHWLYEGSRMTQVNFLVYFMLYYSLL